MVYYVSAVLKQAISRLRDSLTDIHHLMNVLPRPRHVAHIKGDGVSER